MKQVTGEQKLGKAAHPPSTNYSIREFVDRIRGKKASARAILDEVRQIYADARATGLDKTVLGTVVTYIEKREKDPAAFALHSATFDRYLQEHDGTMIATHAHAPEAPNSPPLVSPSTPANISRVETEKASATPQPTAPILSKLARSPDCLQPDLCRSDTWRKLCYSCEMERNARGDDTSLPDHLGEVGDEG